MADSAFRAAGERRYLDRVTPVQRIRGTMGNVPIVVIDVSLVGLRVAHQEALPDIGRTAPLTFEWEGRRFSGTCEVRRTTVEKPARSKFEKTLYHSGLYIVSKDPASAEVVRDLIETCVSRALDEQKANARGIPAMAAQSVQTGGTSDEFLRCELGSTGWTTTPTRDSRQPENGFTISGSEPPSKVEMLRRTWEIGDADARRLIRTFASLSISKAEGIPTRRYAP